MKSIEIATLLSKFQAGEQNNVQFLLQVIEWTLICAEILQLTILDFKL